MPFSECYHDQRKSFKKVQVYADMIPKGRTRGYLLQWNQRSKWSKEHVRNLKKGELVWLIDDSVKRCEYKATTTIDVFTDNDGIVRSARVKMARQNSKMVKAENFTIWDRNFVHPPIFGRETQSNRRLQHTDRDISTLFMDPTNVFASNSQVWLLPLI